MGFDREGVWLEHLPSNDCGILHIRGKACFGPQRPSGHTPDLLISR